MAEAPGNDANKLLTVGAILMLPWGAPIPCSRAVKRAVATTHGTAGLGLAARDPAFQAPSKGHNGPRSEAQPSVGLKANSVRR